jgi:hypothetical protein
MKSTRRLLYLAAVGTGLIFCSAAQAEDWKVPGEFGWFAVGKAQEIEKGHSYWVGEYAGTFFNDKGENTVSSRRCEVSQLGRHRPQ